ncbi:MAG: hypothetical protein Q9166_006843 [cf. Caloplaca sp. 2 TL-2023]
MERPTKRISSIFSLASLGSTASDKSSKSSNTSFPPPSSHLSQSSHGSSPPRKPLPASANLRPLLTSASSQELCRRQKTPSFGPTLSPPLTGEDGSSASFGNLTPLPQRLASPGASSPSRPGSGSDSRPGSPPKGFLRPLTPVSDAGRPDSRASSRPNSSASSPHKDFHRPFTQVSGNSRPVSGGDFGNGSRAVSPSKRLSQNFTTAKEQKITKRRSWLPTKSRPVSQVEDVQLPKAWILAPSSLDKTPYDVSALANFQKVPELWNESGDVTVYLHPKEAYRGPSFRVESSVFAASRRLTSMARGNVNYTFPMTKTHEEPAQQMTLQLPEHRSRPASPAPMDGSSQGSRRMSDTFEETPGQDVNLYLPLALQADLTSADATLRVDDIDQLIAVRNVFAFLVGQPLVATPNTPAIFGIFLKIADFLQRYEFSNLDGSTLGEDVTTNFKEYIKYFSLGDIRTSREKTMEAIILGERMRSWDLYNEGFVHGVGKYEEILKLKSPKYHMITDTTTKRLERATLDLNSRLKTVRTRLESFDFPSAFAGIANSTTSTESKTIRFKAWKASFLAMRRHVMTIYKERYGAWPPSAKSKKNEFEESGLNRILLQEVYQDFADLYDALVNRRSITSRSTDLLTPGGEMMTDGEDFTAAALRRVMDEYDRSSPPVQPPVPFDTPLLPSLKGTRSGFESWDAKKQKKENTKRLTNDEINMALMQSYNRQGISPTPFVEAFMNFERQAARGKTIEEMQDLRNGQWLFMYAVIQSLPLVVVDAPGVQWTKGVEYFLCEVPKGTAPWTQEPHNRGWYSVAGGAGVVSLPTDIIDHGVEGIYRRSHCWRVAEKWSGFNDLVPTQSHETTDSQLMPPPPLLSPDDSFSASRSGSPDQNKRRQSVQLGLEALPLPAGVAPAGAKPVVACYDPSKSFEAILGGTNTSKLNTNAGTVLSSIRTPNTDTYVTFSKFASPSAEIKQVDSLVCLVEAAQTIYSKGYGSSVHLTMSRQVMNWTFSGSSLPRNQGCLVMQNQDNDNHKLTWGIIIEALTAVALGLGNTTFTSCHFDVYNPKWGHLGYGGLEMVEVDDECYPPLYDDLGDGAVVTAAGSHHATVD